MAGSTTSGNLLPPAAPGAVRGPAPSARAFVVCCVAFVLAAGVATVVLAWEHARPEIACAPHPAWEDYGDAHWGWSPPGHSCTYAPDSEGVAQAPTHPPPWRYLFYLVPLTTGGAAAVLGLRWRRAGGRRTPDSWFRYDTSGKGTVSPYGQVTVPVLRWFYADPRRTESFELDLGFPWRDGAPGGWALRWLEGTGELVGFRWSHAWSNRVLRHRHVPGAKLDQVQVLLIEPDRNALRELFHDRAGHLDDPYGWQWVLRRVAEAHGSS